MTFIIAHIIINAICFAGGYLMRYAQQCEAEELDSIDPDDPIPYELRGDFDTRADWIRSMD